MWGGGTRRASRPSRSRPVRSWPSKRTEPRSFSWYEKHLDSADEVVADHEAEAENGLGEANGRGQGRGPDPSPQK